MILIRSPILPSSATRIKVTVKSAAVRSQLAPFEPSSTQEQTGWTACIHRLPG